MHLGCLCLLCPQSRSLALLDSGFDVSLTLGKSKLLVAFSTTVMNPVPRSSVGPPFCGRHLGSSISFSESAMVQALGGRFCHDWLLRRVVYILEPGRDEAVQHPSTHAHTRPCTVPTVQVPPRLPWSRTTSTPGYTTGSTRPEPSTRLPF